jgi:hypothetical protein
MEKMEPLVYLLLAVAHLAQPVQPVQLAHKEHKETQVQLVQPDQQVVEAEAQDRQENLDELLKATQKYALKGEGCCRSIFAWGTRAQYPC